MTRGFNPHPKLTFAIALPLGVESYDEVVDVELDETLACHTLIERLSATAPEGIEFTACEVVDPHARLQILSSRFTVTLDPPQLAQVTPRIAEYLAGGEARFERTRKSGSTQAELRGYLASISIEGDSLNFELLHPQDGGIKPAELLTWLGLDDSAASVVKVQSILQ